LEWDEVVAPFSFILSVEDPLKLPESFTKIFSRKKLEPGKAGEQLLLDLPNLPDELLSKDLTARQGLLDIWNSLGDLTVISDSDIQEDLSKAVRAVSKGLLRPLLGANNTFREITVSLRRKALEKCDQNNPYILRLIRSSPFSAKLFPEKLVKEFLDSSLPRLPIPRARRKTTATNREATALSKAPTGPLLQGPRGPSRPQWL